MPIAISWYSNNAPQMKNTPINSQNRILTIFIMFMVSTPSQILGNLSPLMPFVALFLACASALRLHESRKKQGNGQ
jgi:hypothetical protein